MLVGPSKYLKQIIQIEFNWIPTGRRQISLLFTSIAQDLNSGLQWTNPGSGQSGTRNCKSSALTTRPRFLTFKTASKERASLTVLSLKKAVLQLLAFLRLRVEVALFSPQWPLQYLYPYRCRCGKAQLYFTINSCQLVESSWPLPKRLIITLFRTYPHWSPPCACVHPSHPSSLSTNAYSPPTPQ